MKQRSKQQSPMVALEVCRSQLQVVILRPQGGDQQYSIHARTITWRHEAASLATETGARELAAALRQLVAEEKLAGASACLCLNGDFCVTRAVTGTNNDVRRDLAEMEGRSSLYLSLGTGDKALAASIRQIDARHQHALLTVTNKQVLKTVVEVAEQSGLDVSRVEPSLVALSRILGHMGRDAESPVMIIALSEGGAELGISHEGHLLLDYRPSGRLTNQNVADIAQRHLTRIERYCRRYLQFEGKRLSRAILCGPPDVVAAARAGFAQSQALRVEALDLTNANPAWSLSDENLDSQMGGVLGLALVAAQPEAQRSGPNLMERIRAEARERLLPALWRAAWPIAAAAVVAAGVLGIMLYQMMTCGDLKSQLAELAPTQARIADMQMQMTMATDKIRHLKAVKTKLSNPAWAEILTNLGGCLPEDVWLESVVSNGAGRLTVTGASYGQDGIYEFVRWLQKSPGMAEVALEQTHPTSVSTGPATGFDLSADFSDHSAPVTEGKRHD